MNVMSNVMLTIHIISGFVALVLFWIPVAVKKGSKVHRKVGYWYVFAMSTVAFTAFVLSIENLFTNRMTMGVFLGFLSLLTARPLLLGILCLDSKRQLNRGYQYAHIATSAIVGIAGIGLVAYGLSTPNSLAPVIIIFGILGATTALPDVIKLLKNHYSMATKQWLADHIANMCTAGIAAHTAFLVFGGQSLLPPIQHTAISITLWVAPTVVGLIGIRLAKRKYAPPKSVSKTAPIAAQTQH